MIWKTIFYPVEDFADIILAALSRTLRSLSKRLFRIHEAVLLKNLGGIGDYILLTASLEGYRRLFPDKKIVLMVRQEVLGLAKRSPFIDSAIGLRYQSFRINPIEKLRIWYSMLQYEFLVAINLDYSTTWNRMDNSIFRWSNAPRKIAFQCLDKASYRNYALYDTINNQNSEWMFEIDRNNEMLRFLGLESYRNERTYLWGLNEHVMSEDVKSCLTNVRYYVIFSGSLLKGKCWPASKFSLLIQKLNSLGYISVLCGSKLEKKINAQIAQQAVSVKLIDLTGKTTLMDLACVIKNSEFLISNDTSAVHIARAVGTKTFVLLGGGHYGRFLPYPGNSNLEYITMSGMDCFNCYWACKYDYFKCIEDITVENVADVIFQSIQSRSDFQS